MHFLFRLKYYGVICLVNAALLSLSLNSAPRHDVRGDMTVDHFSRYAKVEIVSDRITYRSGEEVPVRFRITNDGKNVLRVYPDAEPGRSYQFSLSDRSGREIPISFHRISYYNREHGKPVITKNGEKVKEMILHPGETHEVLLYLNDFYDLKSGQEYRLIGYYYPDARFEHFVRTKNQLTLRISKNRDDDFIKRQTTPDGKEEKTGLSPEETVYLFLSAEMRRNWKNYLKYIDLRKFIISYDRFASKYVLATDIEKPAVLREFATFLTGDIPERLKKFKITGESPERDEHGEAKETGRMNVTVLAQRETGGYTARYEYVYILEPHAEGFWKIVAVTARLVR